MGNRGEKTLQRETDRFGEEEDEDHLLRFSPSAFSSFLISSTNGSSTFVHEMNSGKVVGHLDDHNLRDPDIESQRSWFQPTFSSFAATFSAQIGIQEIATCSLSGVVRIWEITSSAGKGGKMDCRVLRFYCPTENHQQFYGMHFLRKYRLLAVGGSGYSVMLINPFSDNLMNTISLDQHPASCYGLTSFESTLFCASTSRGGLQAFDIETTKLLWMDGAAGPMYCGLHVDPETQLLFSASSEDPVAISVFDARTLTHIKTHTALNTPSSSCYDFCLKDGRLILPFSETPNGEIRIYDLRDLANPVTSIETDHQWNWRAACDCPGHPFFAIASMSSSTTATYTLQGKEIWKSNPSVVWQKRSQASVRGVCCFNQCFGEEENVSDKYVQERIEFVGLSSLERRFPHGILRILSTEGGSFEFKFLLSFVDLRL